MHRDPVMNDQTYELAKQDDGNEVNAFGKKPMKHMTPRQKTCVLVIVGIVIFIALMLLIGTILLGVQVSKLKSDIKDMKAKAPCTTVDCINTVSDLMSAVNPKIDPCVNFHEYACGKWPEKNPIPFPDKTWAPLHKLRVDNEQTIQRLIQRKYTRIRYSKNEALLKVFTFYDSCMDEDAIEKDGSKPLMKLINRVGSTPYFDPSWNNNTWDVVKALSFVNREVSVSPFFLIWINVLQSNTTVSTLNISPNGLGLRMSRYNSTKDDDMKIKKAYKQYLVDLLRVLGVGKNESVDMMESIYNVEFDLVKLDSKTKKKSPQKRLQIKDLQRGYNESLMNWTRFFKDVFRENNFTPDENTKIKIFNSEYFQELNRYLSTKPKGDLANYIVWMIITRYSKLLSKKYQKPYDDFLKAFNYGPQTDNPRWERCITEVKHHFGMAIGRMFVDEVFRNGSKNEAIELVNDIKKAFIDDFDSVDWMDEKTRKAAKQKAEAMHGNIGYPDFIMDNKKLAEQYKMVRIRNNTYFDNTISVEKASSIDWRNELENLPSRKEWVITPTTINAVYAPTKNTMDIPAGILQKPLFSHTYPGSINFGAIGAIVGHEMTHGFDTMGKKFNQFGHAQRWWSNASNENFDRKAKCFVAQYGNLTYRGMQMNGKRILGEVIADNGGTEIAFKAYKIWEKEHGKEQQLPGIKLTHDQIFFVAYAQIFCSVYTDDSAKMYMNRLHPINPLRIQGVAMNSKEFAKAFKCPVGSPMNPAKKCKIW